MTHTGYTFKSPAGTWLALTNAAIVIWGIEWMGTVGAATAVFLFTAASYGCGMQDQKTGKWRAD